VTCGDEIEIDSIHITPAPNNVSFPVESQPALRIEAIHEGWDAVVGVLLPLNGNKK